ncbi:MAG TPA: TonB-dependent receptor plug domain-containing protein [Gemmatimonadaceae bacterium]|nr:TonB-dependent receptor plug domain-containing protein [Gemmatimonadaceae bacterium]
MFPPRSWAAQAPFAIALATLLAACGPANRTAKHVGSAGSHIITATTIAGWHVNNAWDALRHDATFNLSDTGADEPAGIESRRGPSSILLHNADVPLIYVDGAQLSNLGALRQISAQSIEEIEILSGIDATVHYGTGAGAGAIIIHTRVGPGQ